MSPYPPLAALGVVLTWWGWKTGAFFGDVLIPGVIALSLVLGVMLVRAPWDGRLRGPAAWALGALAALAGWTLVSFLWTPAKEVAIADAERVFAYVLLFALGAWVTLLLGRQMLLALLPVAVAGAAVGLATLATVAVGDDTTRYLDTEGLLSYPLGYHNAVAAFTLLTAIAAVALASGRTLPWWARGVLTGSVTISLGLAVLTQSRGAVFAAAIGFLVLVLLSRSRLGTLGWLGLAAAPLLPAVPFLLDVYSAAGEEVEAAGDELSLAGGVLLLAGAAATGLGCLAARNEPRLELAEQTRRKVGVAVVALAVVAVAVPSIVVVAREGGPAEFFDRRAEELSSGDPDFRSTGGTRLGVNLGTDRGDLWAVAVDDGKARPLHGRGAGGFEYSFLRARDTPEELTSEDPHSAPLLMLSELGLVGLALFGVFVAGSAIAVWRSRRLGPAAAALSGATLACFALWLVHAGVDWFWHYPAVTGPVAMLLGAASAPALRVLEPAMRDPRRLGAAVALAAVSVLLVPLFLSERLLRDGIETGAGGEGDVEAAYADLGLAADLNPWSPAPLIAEAEIAEAAGEPQRALGLLSEAEERKPDDWTPRYLAARILARYDPGAARRKLEEARELNPLGRRIIEAEGVLNESSTLPGSDSAGR